MVAKGETLKKLRGTNISNTRENLFFKNTFIPETENGCMIFKSKNHHGYGTLYIDGKKILAHRFSYQLFIGRIPEKMMVFHLCGNRSCVRPDHLGIRFRKSSINKILDSSFFCGLSKIGKGLTETMITA